MLVFKTEVIVLMSIVTMANNPRAEKPSLWCDFPCGGKRHYGCNHKVESHVPYRPEAPSVTAKYFLHRRIHREAPKDCDVAPELSRAERTGVLTSVNTLRNKIQAANMRQVRWDERLELFSNMLATNYLYHTELHIKDGSDGYFAWLDGICARTQNLPQVSAFYFATSKTKSTVEQIFSVVEKSAPSADWITKFPGPFGYGKHTVPLNNGETPGRRKVDYTHAYTMLVSANASSIACSYGNIKCGEEQLYSFNCFLGSGVNQVDQEVYKSGEVCSACPQDTACNSASSWPNLCDFNSTGDARGESRAPRTVQYVATLLLLILAVRIFK